MVKILIHAEVFDDIVLGLRKRWYQSLGSEMPRICRLLVQDGKLPGEGPVHHLRLQSMQNKTIHAGINLPQENVDKRRGARIIYVKENFDLLKVLYVGGHKDDRYDDSNRQVQMIESRYLTDKFIEYSEGLDFSNASQ
ncbi:MAG: hypothetical protein Q8N90_04490 [bacterium]|nr:hypothetical protein [bacterium]